MLYLYEIVVPLTNSDPLISLHITFIVLIHNTFWDLDLVYNTILDPNLMHNTLWDLDMMHNTFLDLDLVHIMFLAPCRRENLPKMTSCGPPILEVTNSI
jgi:hypothetical protein